MYTKKIVTATAIGGAGIVMGSFVPPGGLLGTFALSVWVGSQAVQGVSHALHSPLMSITNAISGMTAVGGMLQLGGGVMPHSTAQVLAFSAVGYVSFVFCSNERKKRKRELMIVIFCATCLTPSYFSR